MSGVLIQAVKLTGRVRRGLLLCELKWNHGPKCKTVSQLHGRCEVFERNLQNF
jgi:hypothetical protein